MGIFERFASIFRKDSPTAPWYEPSLRDRWLLTVGTQYDKLAISGFLTKAHNGDTRLLSIFKQEMRASDAHLDGELRKVESMLTQAPLSILPFPASARRRFAAPRKKSDGPETGADKSARLAAPKPNPETQMAQDIASYVRDQVLDPDVNIAQAIRHFFWGLCDFASGCQVVVEPGGISSLGPYSGKERLRMIEPIPSERFRFIPGTVTLAVQPGEDQSVSALIPVGDLGPSLALITADAHLSSPARRGILRKVITPWLTKRYGMEWWSRRVELFGMPFRKGKYPMGDDARRSALKLAMQEAGAAGFAAFPDGTDLEFLFAAQSTGASDVHETLITFCDKAMSKVLMGSTQTSDIQRGAGSRASANVHMDIAERFVESYAQIICAVLREQIIKPLVARNFGDDAADIYTPVPVLRVKSYDDLLTLSQSIDALAAAGFEENIPISWVHEASGIPVPEDDEPVLEKSTPPPSPFGAGPLGNPAAPPKPPAPGQKPEDASAGGEVIAFASRRAVESEVKKLDSKALDEATGSGTGLIEKYVHLIEQVKRDGGDLGHLASRVRLAMQMDNKGKQETADVIAAVCARALHTGFIEEKRKAKEN